ncbi:porin [Amphritea sp.]|uniref:porin n=1 Tax=Amphritea sp. TaxID=1872502 RepID=UPI003D11AD25
MKKSIIALAVAGALTAPMVAQADATLYGKFEMRLVNPENGDMEIQSDDFRVGVKGDSDIAGGSKALFNLELEVDPDLRGQNTAANDTGNTNAVVRKAYVGATGDWGTTLVGRIANPAEQIIGFTGNNSEATTVSDQNPDHLGSALAYVTPNMGGFTGYAAVVMDGQTPASLGTSGTEDGDNIDGKLIGGSFSAAGLTVAASYWTFEDKYIQDLIGVQEKLSEYSLGAQYSIDMTTVGVMYLKKELDNSGLEYKVYGIRADQKIGDLTLGANYHNGDLDGAGEVDQWGLFATYALGAQAALDFELVNVDYDNDLTNTLSVPANAAVEKVFTGLPSDGQTVSLGYTVKF